MVTTLGIDLAKSSFHIHGVNGEGKQVVSRALTRKKLIEYVAKLSPCVIAMEACGSSHHFARKFMAQGHEVKLIAPQFVKPFVKSQKNDRNDAEAIVEASLRPQMRFVKMKTVEQQDVQILHRIRSRLVGSRTALMNEIRGMLAEYGIAIPLGVSQLKKSVPTLLEEDTSEMSGRTRALLCDLREELEQIEMMIEKKNREIEIIFENSEAAQRIEKIAGVGVMTATAIVASVGDAKQFKNGRQFSAWLGLVPRQNSTGGRTTLLGITKRGDAYLRTLLIHGGRSMVRSAKAKTDVRSTWVNDKVTRRGHNRACVAVANKNARVIWKLLTTGESYRPAA